MKFVHKAHSSHRIRNETHFAQQKLIINKSQICMYRNLRTHTALEALLHASSSLMKNFFYFFYHIYTKGVLYSDCKICTFIKLRSANEYIVEKRENRKEKRRRLRYVNACLRMA